jgi:hypothetical protein
VIKISFLLRFVTQKKDEFKSLKSLDLKSSVTEMMALVIFSCDVYYDCLLEKNKGIYNNSEEASTSCSHPKSTENF